MIEFDPQKAAGSWFFSVVPFLMPSQIRSSSRPVGAVGFSQKKSSVSPNKFFCQGSLGYGDVSTTIGHLFSS